MKSLTDLAACAANETQPPDFAYLSGTSELVVTTGAKTTSIGLHHPYAAHCTSNLQVSLEALVGWED
jgi:hypothetical protein